ncbi:MULTISPECIES: hypothetical protein [Sphingomonas]|uniref:Uncharacterized protein n=1 Tax=Sphingomonas kyungheensis TaxID=1069987 RepID=A0ABU8H722_9SPHN|nr:MULTISPECIES: hypothetical protein [unclassified Sphingomonas]EZP50770.1 hypothetical protein BW41_03110 [Sphingomonas sp. RIT328]
MTRRDLRWKLVGVALTAAGCALLLVLDRSPLMIAVFPLAFAGLPLMIHGKRVGQAIRAERRGHYNTAEVLHAARLRRRIRRDADLDP